MLIQPRVVNHLIEATATIMQVSINHVCQIGTHSPKIAFSLVLATLLTGSGFSGMGFAGNSRPIFPAPTSLPNGVIFSLSPQIDPGSVRVTLT